MPVSTFPLGIAVEDDPLTSMLQTRLFSNDPPADGFTDLAQIVEVANPTYQGSTPEDWYDPDVIDPNWVYRKSKKVNFLMAESGTDNLAKGWYVTILLGGVTTLVAWEAFGVPISSQTKDEIIVVQCELNVYDVAFVAP